MCAGGGGEEEGKIQNVPSQHNRPSNQCRSSRLAGCVLNVHVFFIYTVLCTVYM